MTVNRRPYAAETNVAPDRSLEAEDYKRPGAMPRSEVAPY